MDGSAGLSHRATLAHQLGAMRRRYMVGRSSEKELFRTALESSERPFALLHIRGVGGVGKTTLLNEFVNLCLEYGALPVFLDGRDIELSPQGFLWALQLALDLEPNASPLDALFRQGHSVLLLDTYELMAPIDGWLRRDFLPGLSEKSLVVLAGREPLSPAWRTDPGWQGLTRSLSLRNLRPEESRDYLGRRGVPQGEHNAMLEFTHGHPLALSLVADVLEGAEGATSFRPETSPDVVRALLERFVQQLPTAAHRTALETCAHVRATTETILRQALSRDDAHDIFEWLRGLSFIDPGPLGLYPHDLARDAIDADFRWRDPEGYVALHRRVRQHYVRKLSVTQGMERLRVFYDIMFLHRHNPFMKSVFDFQALGTVYPEPAHPEDHADILAMTEAHEGSESANIAAYWLQRQPEAFVIIRGATGELLGYGAELKLHLATPEDLEADPGTKAAWNYAQHHAPPRPGEVMTLARFLIDRATYQQPSPVINLFQIVSNLNWLATPNLAWSFVSAYAEPESWRPVMNYIDYARVEEADFEVGGKRYGAYVHDFRVVDAAAWLELMGGRELATDLTLEELEAEHQKPHLSVLSQPEFEDAVKAALRDFMRSAALANNSLLRSRLVQSKGEPTAATLRGLIREAAETLKADSKDEKLYRALLATYLEPAATQELAAERLGLPFSTYRRHLTSGIERVSRWLWERELYGSEGRGA